MDKKLISFQEQMSQLSLVELEEQLEQLQLQLGQMILNNDLLAHIAIVETLIEEKKGGVAGE